MKVQLLCIAKTEADWIKRGCEEYQNRLKHYLSYEVFEIQSLKNAKSLSFDEIKKKEGELLLQKITAGDYVILLDERGLSLSSIELSQKLEKWSMQRSVVFVIGGAYGFSDDVYERANAKLSLSRLTFSHQMIRVIFVEQLYRACTILKGEPYHHE